MNGLAELYNHEGKSAQSETLFKETLEAERRVLGEGDDLTLDSMNGLADLYGGQGKYDQAEALYAKVLELRRRFLGEEHPGTINTVASLGRVRLLQQKYTEAAALLRSTLQAYQETGSDTWELHSCESMLGASLGGQKKFEEAEPLLVSGYQGMLQREATIPAAERTNLREAGQRIVQLYQEWGKPAQAAEWRAKLQALPPAPTR